MISLTGGLIGILIGAGFATALPFIVEFFSSGDQQLPDRHRDVERASGRSSSAG